jgi:hypothetical protein
VPKLDYPKILTNKDWQSKKSALDKVGKNKKTGVGEQLTALEKLYAKTDYAKPSEGLKLIQTTFDPIRFKAELGKMRQHYTTERKKIEAQFLVTDKKIDDAIKTLGAASSTGKHLAKIKLALRDFRGHDMAEHVHQVERASVAAYRANLKKSMAYSFVEDKGQPGRKNVAPYKEYLGKIQSFKDVDHYFGPGELSANPPGRALSTLCQNWDQVMLPDFPEYAKKFYAAGAMDKVLRGGKWLYELATPGTSGSLVAVEELKKALQKAQSKGATEADVVAAFKTEALKSWAAAEKFLGAYFAMIDKMPKDLATL